MHPYTDDGCTDVSKTCALKLKCCVVVLMFQIPSYCCGMFQTFINSFLGNKTTSNYSSIFIA